MAKELTPKQREVVNNISGGLTVNETAEQMGINPQGVYGHIRRIKEAGLSNLLEHGAVAALEGNGNSSRDGSPRIEMNEVHGQVLALVEQAVAVADERVKVIGERRNDLANQVANLRSEDEALEAEAEALTAERNKLDAPTPVA